MVVKFPTLKRLYVQSANKTSLYSLTIHVVNNSVFKIVKFYKQTPTPSTNVHSAYKATTLHMMRVKRCLRGVMAMIKIRAVVLLVMGSLFIAKENVSIKIV